MRDSNHQIRAGAVFSYATVAFNALSGLLYTPWMVSTIGSDHYGLYTLAMSVINLFVMDFGLGEAVSRFLAKYYAEGDERGANAFVGMVLKIYFVISVALFVILGAVYLNVDAIYANLNPNQLLVFKRLYVIVGLYSVVALPLTTLNGTLAANELFVKLNACNLAQRILTVGAIVAALLMGFGVYALVVVNAAVGLLVSAVKLVFVKTGTTMKPEFSVASRYGVREVLGFSAWTLTVQLCQRAVFTLVPSVMAIVSSSWEIALFGLAATLEGYVWSVANALNGMFMPKVTRTIHEDPSMGLMQALAVRVGRIQLFITGAIIVIFAALGRDFVECWMGPEYSGLYLCTLLLILPELAELPTMIEGTALVSIGRVKEKGMAYISMAAINLVLSFFLSRANGAVGACLSICIAYFTRTLSLCLSYRRHLSFSFVNFARDVYMGWVSTATLVIMGGLAISSVIPLRGWLGFLAEALVVAALYVGICWGLTLNEGEREQVKSAIKELGSR